MPTERQADASIQAGTASISSAASTIGGKWSERASIDPFAAPGASVELEETTIEDGKENKAPSSSMMHLTATVRTPTLVRRTSHGGKAVAVVTKPPPSSLGKRLRGFSPTRSPLAAFKMARLSTASSGENENDDDKNDGTQRTLFRDDSKPTTAAPVVVAVTDFVTIAELHFGAVAVGQRKTLLLTLTNPSQAGNARIKYDGYVMASATRENLPKQTLDVRFKCDLHVCTVPAEGKVTLRITFEPFTQDVHQELVARLRFTVNDRFHLQCEVSGSGLPAMAKPLSLRERMAMGVAAHANKNPHASEELPRNTSVAAAHGEGELALRKNNKRRESLALVVSPPRHRKAKRVRVEDQDQEHDQDNGDDSSSAVAVAAGGFQGSWWEKRKTLSDEEWMQRQEEGFTKWMNFVLIESTGDDDQEQNDAAMIIEHPHRMSLGGGTPSRSRRPQQRRRQSHRIDFSSLRVLAMKRMESMWSRAAMEIYRSDAVTDAAANLKNEIADGKLVVRRDRPAYADVGLQEELLELLNNYHPVWLCLALETVLGHRTMAQEKCSLRSVMTYCANVADKTTLSSKTKTTKQGDAKASATRMPRQLRRVILQHLVHDVHVAKRHRLVKNLKMPVGGDGSSFRTAKANARISGRDYFDALMDAFVFKFLMVVLLLDRAAAHRSDKFTRFPCVFRVQPVKSSTSDDDRSNKIVKNSQRMVAEFCRVFLSKEGRIDRHLKQLGYSVNFQQVPLDEVELEITNLAVDLRDGVRLAKLLETLTATPGAPRDQELQLLQQKKQKLSAFLRVPALSRLQKIHNVEICLHFLQEKCGRDFLESIRSTVSQSSSRTTAGRLSFATLRDKEDAKLLESMAKAVVDGHREKTLALLWKLISVFQLRSLVNVDRLSKEIATIKQRLSFRSMEFYETATRAAAAAAASEASSSSSNVAHEESQGLDHEVRELLLEWCRVVCANYFVRVVDFSRSFADGRAMCFLLHYYHPMLLTKPEIQLTTTEYATSTTRAIHSEREIARALGNERRHFSMVNERVKQLGEVPVLLPEHQYDSTNPPDDRVIVTFVCYLQSRLMDSSREIHAAARLKRWWRSPRIRLLMRRKKNVAARVIQRMWYTSSVKRLAIRRCRRLLQAARLIAATMSAWLQRARFLKLRRAVVALQRAFQQKRVRHASEWSQGQKEAAHKIQSAWRRHKFRQHMQFQVYKRVVCGRVIQRVAASRIKCVLQVNMENKRDAREALRRYQEMLYQQRLDAGKKALLRKVHVRCANTIQSCVRGFLVRKHERLASIAVQKCWRGVVARKSYALQRAMAVRVQRAVRSWIKRRQDEAKERFRRMLVAQERERKLKVLRATVETRQASRVQTAWRSFMYKKKATAATKIQSVVRGKRCQKLLHKLKNERDYNAAVVLQSWIRMVLARRRFVVARHGAVRLQSAVRGVLSRKNVLNFAQFRCTARRMRTKMAKWKIEQWTNKIAQSRTTMRAAATMIQKTWRMHVAFTHLQGVIRSAVRIQARVRGVQSRAHKLHFAAFRAKMARTRMLLAAWTIACWARTRWNKYHRHRHEAAIRVQSQMRRVISRRRFLAVRKAAVAIQARVKGIQSRATKLNFRTFKSRAVGSQQRLALWKIQAWVVQCVHHQRRTRGAIAIQKTVRMLVVRARYQQKRQAATMIQACVRGALSRRYVFDFAAFKRKQLRCRTKMALWKLENWLVDMAFQMRVSKMMNQCAVDIQTAVRGYVARRKFVAMRQAAVVVQSLVRGVQSRCHKHDHAAFRRRMDRLRGVCAAWTIQLWGARHYRQRKACRAAVIKAKWTRLSFGLLRSRLRAVDAIVRCWSGYKLRVAVAGRVETTRGKKTVAATCIQQWWVGKQLQYAAKRELVTLRSKRLQQIQREHEQRRQHAVQLIARCWSGYRLRQAIVARVETTRANKLMAATRLQQWWISKRLQLAAKQELAVLRFEWLEQMQRAREQRRQQILREREQRAATCLQAAWRNKKLQTKARTTRASFQKLREFCASICVASAVFRHVIRRNRATRGVECAARRVQSWWRGMLVRLHEKRHAVTQQRKRLATMTLVTPEPYDAASQDPQQQQQQQTKRSPVVSNRPLTLGARLEMALHMLLHGKRLQEMLFASHTIELCTRYSRECAWKCVELKIATTIFAAIRGLNRSRPHVELLHQLLLVLVNLTTYQRKESKSYTLPSIVSSLLTTNQQATQPQPLPPAVDQDDLRAVDALVDLLHVHRDMHVVFVLASRILKHYLVVLKPHTAQSKEVFHQWSEAHRRLRALHELLTKKMQVAAWTSTNKTTSSSSQASTPTANVMAKINPKTAVAVVGQLLKVLES